MLKEVYLWNSLLLPTTGACSQLYTRVRRARRGAALSTGSPHARGTASGTRTWGATVADPPPAARPPHARTGAPPGRCPSPYTSHPRGRPPAPVHRPPRRSGAYRAFTCKRVFLVESSETPSARTSICERTVEEERGRKSWWLSFHGVIHRLVQR